MDERPSQRVEISVPTRTVLGILAILALVAVAIVSLGTLLSIFVAAVLLNRYGDWIRERIERHLGLWVAIGVAVIVLGFVIAIKLI